MKKDNWNLIDVAFWLGDQGNGGVCGCECDVSNVWASVVALVVAFVFGMLERSYLLLGLYGVSRVVYVVRTC